MSNTERKRLRALQNRFLKICRPDLDRIGRSTPLWGPGSPTADDLEKIIYPDCEWAMRHSINVREGKE